MQITPEQMDEIEAMTKVAKRFSATFTMGTDLAVALVAHVREIEKERDEAREAIAEANNSLFGSKEFFLSLIGGKNDKNHLSRAIEELKRQDHAANAIAERDDILDAYIELNRRADDVVTAWNLGGKMAPFVQALAAALFLKLRSHPPESRARS